MYELTRRDRKDAEGAKGLAVGLIVGALLGAGAALLWAPTTGDETRKVLRRGARKLSQRSSAAFGDVTEDAERTARRLMRRGRKYAAQARSVADDLIDEGRRYTER